MRRCRTRRTRRTRRIVLATATLLGVVILAACGPSVPPAPPIASTPQADDLVERTNYLRSLGGQGALTVDGGMQVHAQAHAARLAGGATTCAGALWHSPELGSWYSGLSAAENLACVSGCPPDAKVAFDNWVRSPLHNANQMNGAYNYIGTAAYCNGSVMIAVGQYRSG